MWRIVLASIAIALYAVMVPIQSTLYATFVPLAFVLSALVCGSMVVAVSAPRTGTALFLVGLFGSAVAGGAGHDAFWPWPLSVPVMIALALLVGVVAFRTGWRPGLIAWLLALLVTIVVLQFPGQPRDPDATAADLIVAFSIAGVLYFIALLVAGRERIQAELTREREVSADEQSRRLLVEERARIAREMHDVVAHSMSLIQVQASTARYRLPDLDAAAAAEFDDIAASARSSLTEMRRLLGALRTEDQSAERAPQQTIADIPALVDAASRAGVDITLERVEGAQSAPPSVQIAAFRIVQEGVSNAVRHAPGSRVSVSVREQGALLVIDVSNAAATEPVHAAAGGGHGLIGMRERTTLLGGSLDTRPSPDGGWHVHATLPWDTMGAASAPEERS
ncbi:Signal transduction histidine kinase [Paramicrobacterium humi]|uniref:histidine kinase n=1 Tax=Paramicrobacterium humi TaxID=640635 RepID=A0A1H4MHI9_9MICO|nr:Signal transduction histidine kinase [Microbacterium humi]